MHRTFPMGNSLGTLEEKIHAVARFEQSVALRVKETELYKRRKQAIEDARADRRGATVVTRADSLQRTSLNEDMVSSTYK